MRSNLKEIYINMNKVEMITKSKYILRKNPIFQVNEFIKSIEPNLNNNFINNLQTLKVEDECDYQNAYDYETNTLFCKDSKSDVYGLLHVASNDLCKNYTGVIIDDEIGYALNNGLTEAYTKIINNKKPNYSLEVLVANKLLEIDFKNVSRSYFKNEGNDLLELFFEIRPLMQALDCYHDNSFTLISLYRQLFSERMKKFKNNDEIEKINYNIDIFENANIDNVFNVLYDLINLINFSNIEGAEKQRLLLELRKDFGKLLKLEQFSYLNVLPLDFVADTKKRIR